MRLVRYLGAKWALADRLVALMPPHRVYVEVFGGSAAVLFKKPRSAVEVYNDLDRSVATFFRVLRDQPDELHRVLLLTPYSREEQELSMVAAVDDLEVARRFFVRCWQTRGGYHGSTGGSAWQNNQSGWTSQIQQYVKATDVLPNFARRLRGVMVEHADYRQILDAYDSPETLFYVDPPYPFSARRGWGTSYPCDLRTDEEHADLLDRCLALRGAVMVSGYSHQVYDQRLTGWARHVFRARNMRGNACDEVVWCSSAPRQLQVFA
ncbi:MAG: DNA adenine methylase [Patescibacteria group bacterium]|jgi:DNA adenine methylase